MHDNVPVITKNDKPAIIATVEYSNNTFIKMRIIVSERPNDNDGMDSNRNVRGSYDDVARDGVRVLLLLAHVLVVVRYRYCDALVKKTIPRLPE